MRICLVIFGCFWGQLAHAQSMLSSETAIVESYEASQLAVTVYPDNLAMVTEVRTIDVPAGVSEIQFHGVSDMIVPETTVLQAFEGLRLEGNFNSDLITKASLLKKSVGQTLTIRRMNSVTGQFELVDAELVSAAPSDQGGSGGIQGVVFKTEEGLESLYCSGLAEAVLFSNIPDGLNPIPVLSMKVSSETSGPKEITLTYLTRGLGWEADYRLDVKDGEADATLLGWLTLSNQTSKSFKDAGLAVVAGKLNRAPQNYGSTSGGGTLTFNPTCGHNIKTISNYDDVVVTTGARRNMRYEVQPAPMAVMEAPALASFSDGSGKVAVREATREDLGDYKLYRAPQSVTLNPYQTKQIAFLLKSDVEFEKIHKRTIGTQNLRTALTAPKATRVEYEIDNDRGGNLAQPLPKGTLRVMSEAVDGHMLFTGEDRVTNLAVDLPFEVKIADSFLVTSNFDFEMPYDAAGPYLKLMASVFNATEAPITAEIDFTGVGPSNISRSTAEGESDESRPTYRLQVPAESKEDLTLELPLKRQVGFFYTPEYKSGTYRENSKRDIAYEKAFRGYKYFLMDGKALNISLGELMDSRKPNPMRLSVEDVLRVETSGDIIEYTKTFTFNNLTTAPIDVEFTMGRVSDLDAITRVESSTVPNYEDERVWNITVPGNSQESLTTLTEVPE